MARLPPVVDNLGSQYSSEVSRRVPNLPYFSSPAPSFSFSSSSASTSPSPTGYHFTQGSMQSPNPQAVVSQRQPPASQEQQKWRPPPSVPPANSAPTYAPQQSRGYAGYDSQGMVQQASQPGAIYAELPSYRFPHMPSPGLASPTFQQHFQQPRHSKPAHLRLDQASHPYPSGSWDTASSAGYSTPLMSPALSQHPSSPTAYGPETSTSAQYQLQPPLPIITLPEQENERSQYNDYNAPEEGSASGLVAESGQYEAVPSRDFDRQLSMHPQAQQQSPHRLGGNEIISPTKPSGNGFLGIQYPGHPPFSQSSSPAGYHYATSSTTHHTTSSTFIPSSAYLPSKAQFSDISPQLPSMPRSAPSTPLGRQDARFLNSMRQQPTPQPLQPSMFIENSSPVPRGTPQMSMAGQSQYSGSPAMQNYYSAEEYYDVSPGPPSGSNGRVYAQSSGQMSPSSPYIPYARPPKTPSSTSSVASKRYSPYSPFPVETPSPAKRIRREEMFASSSSPTKSEFSATSVAASSPAPSTGDEKPKTPRCKIACSACRKTRLKCDGKNPCTSCVEKHLKSNPSHHEAQAISLVEQEGSCLYENFVRRRGKGKKTIEKEREDQIMRTSVGPSRSGSGGIVNMQYSNLQQYPGNASVLGGSGLQMHYSA